MLKIMLKHVEITQKQGGPENPKARRHIAHL
jgi:hypothetical protein